MGPSISLFIFLFSLFYFLSPRPSSLAAGLRATRRSPPCCPAQAQPLTDDGPAPDRIRRHRRRRRRSPLGRSPARSSKATTQLLLPTGHRMHASGWRRLRPRSPASSAQISRTPRALSSLLSRAVRSLFMSTRGRKGFSLLGLGRVHATHRRGAHSPSSWPVSSAARLPLGPCPASQARRTAVSTGNSSP